MARMRSSHAITIAIATLVGCQHDYDEPDRRDADVSRAERVPALACPGEQKMCGAGCIPNAAACCPNGDYCTVGTCAPDGRSCIVEIPPNYAVCAVDAPTSCGTNGIPPEGNCCQSLSECCGNGFWTCCPAGTCYPSSAFGAGACITGTQQIPSKSGDGSGSGGGNAGSCPTGKVACENGCIFSDQVCCPSEGGYCNAGETCGADGCIEPGGCDATGGGTGVVSAALALLVVLGARRRRALVAICLACGACGNATHAVLSVVDASADEPHDSAGSGSGSSGGGAYSQVAVLKASPAVEDGYFGVQVAASGDTIAVLSREVVSGVIRVYRSSDDVTWKLEATISAQSTTEAIALDGDRLVIGGANSAAVYHRAGATWSPEAMLSGPNTVAFGSAVAISGDAVVVGDYAATSYKGFIYVFKAPGWQPTGVALPPENTPWKVLGATVAITGDTVFASSFVDGPGSTQAQTGVFAYPLDASGHLGVPALLRASNAPPQPDRTQFGVRLAAAGMRVAISASGEQGTSLGVDGSQTMGTNSTNAGAVYMFEESAAGAMDWTQTHYLKRDHAAVGAYFGVSIALSNTLLVVGDSIDDKGEAAVFDQSVGSWVQRGELTAAEADAEDNFGSAVGAAGGAAIIGAPGESSRAVDVPGDNSVAASGAVYVFH